MGAWFADRILAAYAGDGARVDTLVADARLVCRTVPVAQALQGHALAAGVARGARRAGAGGLVVLDVAHGALATHIGGATGVETVVVYASGGVRARGVIDAAAGGAAAAHHRVSHLPLGAHAREAPQRVATQGRLVARVVAALVHVDARPRRVPLETSLTVAHGGVVHCLAAAEPTVGVVAWI